MIYLNAVLAEVFVTIAFKWNNVLFVMHLWLVE